MNKVGNIYKKNILFIQGPIGPFFKKLDLKFRSKGANTFKITLNVADWIFSNKDNTYPFKDSKEQWSQFISTFIEEKKIDKIFLFGDCRFYQSVAISAAMRAEIDVFVFEEGYVRPDHITMERYGVNNFSLISRDPQFYKTLPESYLIPPEVTSANPKYWRLAYSAVLYYAGSHLFSFMYPKYVHHRENNALKEFFWFCRNVFRKVKYKFTENGLLDQLTGSLSQKYYFVPLQTYNDFQLKRHSSFSSIESFIEVVLTSYAKYAPKDTYLVLKHHPVDRGRKEYSAYINTLSEELGIAERIIVIHDLHLPSCLQNAIGTVTINSTVGLSSLFHKIPTITLGDAIYNIEGLTCKSLSLNEFWENYTKPDKILFKKFRNYLIEITQLNGSFYGRFPVEFDMDEMYR